MNADDHQIYTSELILKLKGNRKDNVPRLGIVITIY